MRESDGAVDFFPKFVETLRQAGGIARSVEISCEALTGLKAAFRSP